MTKTSFWVLEGFGIECEKETRRCLKTLDGNFEVKSLFLPEFLARGSEMNLAPKKGDWVLFPGGFSFSDHFGSGTLLSYELKKSGILKKWIDEGVNCFGICNGFQILTAAGLFGPETRLLHNRVNDRGLGFINRWVTLHYRLGQSKDLSFRFTARHGEGRLSFPSREYLRQNNVQSFLHYQDEAFDNGSLDRIAGLVARRGKSWIVGMMPHPEIAVREYQGPYRSPGEAMPDHRELEARKSGDGQRFFMELLKDLKEMES